MYERRSVQRNEMCIRDRDKTETAAQSLRLLYDQKATIIKNLIVFNDGVEKKLYANAEDFAEVYQMCIRDRNKIAAQWPAKAVA